MLEKLKAIDELDQQVFHLTLDIRKASQSVKDLQQERESLEKSLKDRADRLQENELKVRNLDLELKESNSKLEKAQAQRMNAANQKMLDTIDSRIQSIEAQLEEQEENWLMAGETMEEFQRQYQEYEQNSKKRLLEIEKEVESLSNQHQSWQRDLKGCLESRPLCLDGLPSEVLEVYEKVRSRDPNKRVVCAMTEDHCPVCRMQLSGNIFESIRHGGQVEKCPHCSMVLYFDSEI